MLPLAWVISLTWPASAKLGCVAIVLLMAACVQGCQMAKFDPFLSLDCARVEGVGRNPRKGRDQILQRSVAEP